MEMTHLEVRAYLTSAQFSWVLVNPTTMDAERFGDNNVIVYGDFNEALEDCKGLGDVIIMSEFDWLNRPENLLCLPDYINEHKVELL